jgi:hypothetical protein
LLKQPEIWGKIVATDEIWVVLSETTKFKMNISIISEAEKFETQSHNAANAANPFFAYAL